jgi:very-short-patch-repair endonuclease
MSQPERRLWYRLRAKRLYGIKFKRQVPIGPYVVDFCAKRHRFIVEVDGRSHAGQVQYDQRRQRTLENCGYTVLRVSNDDVIDNIEGVLAYIASQVQGRAAPSPEPSPPGERG